jgi:hypothetical protein
MKRVPKDGGESKHLKSVAASNIDSVPSLRYPKPYRLCHCIVNVSHLKTRNKYFSIYSNMQASSNKGPPLYL